VKAGKIFCHANTILLPFLLAVVLLLREGEKAVRPSSSVWLTLRPAAASDPEGRRARGGRETSREFLSCASLDVSVRDRDALKRERNKWRRKSLSFASSSLRPARARKGRRRRRLRFSDGKFLQEKGRKKEGECTSFW